MSSSWLNLAERWFGTSPEGPALDAAGITPFHHAVLDMEAQRAADLVKLGFSPLTPDSRGITCPGFDKRNC